VQLRHTAPQELLYARQYWYRSGLNPVITDDLAQIVDNAMAMVALAPGDIVLDIGANDGTLLKRYPEHITRVGCEPAENLTGQLREVTQWVINDFWTIENWREQFGEKKAKVVTAIGMFYDMEDPNQFIRDAAQVLSNDGIFIAQLMCLRPMLEKNDLGNICHEHLEYYSYSSLKYLFEANGLEIFRVEENEINGGSYRLFARTLRTSSISFEEGGDNKRLVMEFFDRVLANKQACVDYVSGQVALGKKVYAYGASTKGNTLLQYYGLDSTLISGAADKDELKWGKLTVGSWIPIVSETEARENADHFLVLPWAFWKTFYEREATWITNGGKFIVPLPEMRVLDNSSS
jgi:cyclopropane fatty-acyl-phospholipid synthase-like methyltransferase